MAAGAQVAPVRQGGHDARLHPARRPKPMSMSIPSVASTIVLALALAAGCQREPAAPQAQAPQATPTGAVTAMAAKLKGGDLAGYASTAVPPALHAELEAAWREGRSHWPLSELPLAGKLAPLLAAFAAEGSEAKLQAAFDRQFAGAERELDAAAESLALFGVEYVRNEGDFSDAERQHYAQVIEALGAWAAAAPLADPQRAKASIVRLAAAARAAGLDEPDDFTALGMAGSLERLQPFLAASMRTLADYGLDLRASLDGLQVEALSQDGDRAQVRIRYPLAGRTISTEMDLERIDGRWYAADSLRNARASLARDEDAPEPAEPDPEAAAGTDAPLAAPVR